MRLKLLSVCVCLLSGSSFALTQADIDQLQAQINNLQKTVNQKQMASSTMPKHSATPNNNMLENKFDTVHGDVITDHAMPIGTISKTAMPYILLKNKNTVFNAPLIIGGQIDGDIQNWSGNYQSNNGNYNNGSGGAINIGKLYLFTIANINDWTEAALAVKQSSSSYSLQVERGFVSFGNLARSPWYMEVGATYLPFGVFSGNGPLNNALSTNLFRVSTTGQAVLGFSQDGINANLAAYQGHANADGLINVSYSNTLYTLGAGYLSDVRNLSSGVGQAYTSSGGNILSGGNNPVWDVNGSINLGPVALVGEYDSTLSSAEVNSVDIGKMNAWVLGATYKNKIHGLPGAWLLSYSGTGNMSDIAMPLAGDAAFIKTANQGIQYRWLGSVTTEVSDNLFIGPELVYDKLYNGTYSVTETMDVTAYF